MTSFGDTVTGASFVVGGLLMVVVALCLVAVSSRSRAKLVLAAGYFVGAVATFARGGAFLLPADSQLRYLLGTSSVDLGLIAAAVTLTFVWIYPIVPARGSASFWITLGATGFFVVEVALWFLAREWIQLPSPEYRSAAQWHLLGPFGELGAVVSTLPVWAALRRGARLEHSAERSSRVILTGLLVAALVGPGLATMGWLGATLGGDAYAPTALGPIVGDCCGIVPASWFVAWFVLPIVIVVVEAATRRFLFPLAILGVGFVVGGAALFSSVVTLSFEWLLVVLTAVVPLFAIARYGAFGVRFVPNWVTYVLAASGATAGFFLVSVAIVSIDPESPVVLVVAVLAGFAAAVGVALAVLPAARGWSARLSAGDDTATTHQRLGPYRSFLLQEIESGAPPEETLERLRPVRSSLGVSDHEHAVLEYALRAPMGQASLSRDVAPGRVLLGRYRVVAALRPGGAGAAFVCHDERVDRKVVIKTLRSAGADGLTDVLREARALAKVLHPNVVTLHDVEQIGDEAFIVMEHVEGGSLADRLARGPLSATEFKRLARDVLTALAAVHEAGLVHRDVKPSNVLLTRGGTAKLADFGIAHIVGFETTAAQLAGGASAAGTVRYMSPEQARGRAVGPRSDLFSAAATLFEAWSGKAYLAADPSESAVELQMRAASAGAFDRADAGSPALRAWWTRSLAPTPGERFQSALEMLAALDAALS